jgi:hypothetical protein
MQRTNCTCLIKAYLDRLHNTIRCCCSCCCCYDPWYHVFAEQEPSNAIQFTNSHASTELLKQLTSKLMTFQESRLQTADLRRFTNSMEY